ncbi:hypothetical protein PsYK624_025080 [Phanerochaete sordida]|uniref:F-box domain-containing protein n=1 Tax=Phanerochaete sordida TaxID=48140 RepID=A0A9P3L9X8_9APHY|nr:hypothetical protein PsYK624_025080 [Phanerochaete sordida]
MPTHSLDEGSWLSALSVPLILGAVITFFVVISTGSAAGASPGTLRRDKRRRKGKRRKDDTGERELVRRDIPVEVVEHIIDYLADHRRTLKACALTSRAWLPRARYHLYSTLVVRRRGLDPYKLRFYPQVARCIRHIVIRDGLWLEVTNSVLVKLGHVEILHLSIPYGHMSSDISPAQFPHFPMLKQLRLENVAFHSGEQLLSVLRKLPELSSLSVPLISMNYSDAATSEECITSSRLPRVRLPLQFVHLSVRPTPGRTACEILAMAGPSLTELSIRIVSLSSGLRPTFELLRTLDLARNTALESVLLHFYWSDPLWYYSTPRGPRDAPLATALLGAVHSPAFTQLRLRVVIPGEDESLRWLRYFDVGFLDAFAEPPDDPGLSLADIERAKERAKGLRSLRLEFKFTCALAEPELSRIREHVGNQLPALRRRNILEIECTQ